MIMLCSELMAHIMEWVVFTLNFSLIYEPQKIKINKNIISIAGFVVLYGLFQLNRQWINIVANIGIIFLLSIILYKIRPVEAFANTIRLFIFLLLGELIGSFIMGICTPQYLEGEILELQLFVFVIISKLIYLILVLLVVGIKKEGIMRYPNLIREI